MEQEVERLKAELQSKNSESPTPDVEQPQSGQHATDVDMETTGTFNHAGNFLQSGQPDFNVAASVNIEQFASPQVFSSPTDAVSNFVRLGARSDDLCPQVSNTDALDVQLDDIILSSDSVISLFQL